MGKLRLESYQEFAKRIEFPVIAYRVDTGEVIIMNYEAKLILGQKTTHVQVKLTQDAENVIISELTIEGLDDIEEFEHAVEFGKLEKGACLSRSFDGGELCYSIKEDSTPTV